MASIVRSRSLVSQIGTKRIIISLILLAAILLIVVLQFRNISSSFSALRQADPQSILLCIGCMALSYAAAAAAYVGLSFKPISYRQTYVVQVATGLTNRLLPAGLGSMGLYAKYLHKLGHTAAAATAIVATNGVLGVVGNVLLAVTVLLVQPSLLRNLTLPDVSPRTLAIGVVAVIAVIVLVLIGRRHRSGRVMSFLHTAFADLRRSLHPDRRTALGLGCNIIVTSLYVVVLMLSVSAVGGSISWPAALLILSFATALGAAVPTPGGLGGVEAGLLAGLISFGVLPAVALAGVVLYRGFAFWLPIIPGILVLHSVQRRYL